VVLIDRIFHTAKTSPTLDPIGAAAQLSDSHSAGGNPPFAGLAGSDGAESMTTMLVPEDDLCHELPESEFARESLFYAVPLAEQRMLIEGYVAIRRDRVASRAVMVWGDPDRDGYRPLAVDLAEAPMEGRDLDDFTVAGMRVRQPELLRRVEVSFLNGDRVWDLRFRAAHDAFDYESNAAGCPKMVAENRYEQAGVADGSLVLDGRKIAYAGVLAHRDHAWGTRDWQAAHHWKMFTGQTADGTAFNLFECLAHGRVFYNGFLFRDGVQSPLASCRRVEVAYDDQWLQRRFALELVDETGRVARVTGERFAGGFIDWGGIVLAESAFAVEVDGSAGISYVEAGWPAGYLEHLRDGSWKGLG
jgi:hypothetical protein